MKIKVNAIEYIDINKKIDALEQKVSEIIKDGTIKDALQERTDIMLPALVRGEIEVSDILWALEDITDEYIAFVRSNYPNVIIRG